MKQKKKGLAIFLIIWGAISTLIGALFVILAFGMLLDGNDFISTVIVIFIFMAITSVAGILPLVKGLHIIQGKETTRHLSQKQTKQMNTEKSPMQQKTQPTPPVPQTSIAETPDKKHILCRDEQFDKGDWPFIKALLKIIIYIVLPIILMIVGYAFLNKSAGGMIVANTWQAWASMVITVGGSFLVIFSLLIWAKYNAFGNKFYYFIIHEEDGLSVARLDTGKLGTYVAKQAKTLEKIKATPSPLYILLFLLCSKRRADAYRLAWMQMYFKVNQKHKFIEKLLLSSAYENYSDKIVAVHKIKYFSRGCEVWYAVMINGVQQDRKQYIYRETTNYELLLAKLKEMCANTRTGYELSVEQVKKVRKNIYRRVAIAVISAVASLFILACSYNLYLDASYKAGEMSQSGVIVFSFLEGRIAFRSYRRVINIIYYVTIVIGGILLKLLSDAIRVHIFTYVYAEVLEYYEVKGFHLKRLLGDYQYFAKVQYNGMTFKVGMSKETWEKRKPGNIWLVLRKKTPYCMIHQI